MTHARIVILDAEPVVRSVVAAILEHGGYQVTQTATVPAAMDVVKSEPADLLLTNVYLPGITGREAVQLFKSAYPNLPVLVVSGLPDSDLIQEWAGKVGFDTFPKPFAAQELLDKVHSILADHSSGAALPVSNH